MNHRSPNLSALFLCFACAGISSSAMAQGAVNVTQHHKHISRDGLYVDPAFTTNAAAGLTRDTNFNGTISGAVYAQPLYIEGGPNGSAMVIAVTESNNVYALDAARGTVIWQDHVGTPVASVDLPCGDINPFGITGTPVVDLATRTLYVDGMTTPDGGATVKHMVFALNVDTGATNSGWPVDVNATARFGTNVFTSVTQGQRSALAVMGTNVYVSYGGLAGDCGTYYGWLVTIATNDPSNVHAWSTTARGGGSWSVGGIAGEGDTPFIATGNTFGASTWGGGEAIIRFQPDGSFSTSSNDFWAPTNWSSLDGADADIGGSGPVLVDVPRATPSQLVVALGKDENAYLLNRTNLGGISAPLAQAKVSSSSIIQAAATYQTLLGSYVVFSGNGNQLVSLRIGASNPPTITTAWAKSESGRGSPFVTTTDGSNNVVVWGIGAESDQRLHAFDGDTGSAIYAGGGANELMAGLHRFNTAIAARGRIYVGGDNKIYAFGVPVPPIQLLGMSVLSDGSVQFSFTNTPGLSFTAYSTTNLSLPFASWSTLGSATEISAGTFQFTDSLGTNDPQRFYRITSP